MNSETSVPQDVQSQAKPEGVEPTQAAPATENQQETPTAQAAPEAQPQETAAAAPQPGALESSADAPAGTPTPEVASAPEEASAPVAPASAAPSPAEPSAQPPVEAAAGENDESAEAQRRRPQLNPTVDPTQARAVPNVGTPYATAPSGSPAPAPAATAAPEAADVSAAAADSPEPPAARTEAPTAPEKRAEIPAEPELDESTLAEIESLQSAEASATVASSAPAASAEAGEGEQAVAAPTEETLEPGNRLKGSVLSIHGDDVFFDLGLRSQGVVSLRQFPQDKPPAVGETYDVVVDKVSTDEGLIHCNLPRGRRKVAGNWEALSVGQVVECMVTKTNKGGLEVTVSNLRGFMPAGQVDLRFVSDLEPFVGQKLEAVVLEANPKKRNLVVSRRAFLDIARKEAEENIWQTLEVGQTFTGTVKTLKDYGAFVDIGGVDGFLHVGEISWNRLKHPSEILSEGQQVEVKVLTLDSDKKRIGLGMKQLVQNPWQSAAETYAPGTTVSGKVTRTTDFGAFVELEEGVEGLVHISELDYRRVARVTEVLKEGEQHDFKVLEVDSQRRRISLSLKALKEQPQAPKDEDLAPSSQDPAYERKRRGSLKGGTGGSEGGGGLFGNPGDFGR